MCRLIRCIRRRRKQEEHGGSVYDEERLRGGRDEGRWRPRFCVCGQRERDGHQWRAPATGRRRQTTARWLAWSVQPIRFKVYMRRLSSSFCGRVAHTERVDAALSYTCRTKRGLCMSVCGAHEWAVQKQMNRSSCRIGGKGRLMWVQGTLTGCG